VSTARHRRVRTRTRTRNLVAVALPAMAVALIPVAVDARPDANEAASATVVMDSATAAATAAAVEDLADVERETRVSRSTRERVPAPTETPTPTPEATPTPEPTPEPTVVDHRFATAALNVRVAPARDADVITVLARGAEVGVTGTTDGAWVQVLHDGSPAWVNGDYLASSPPPKETAQPEPTAQKSSGGLSSAPCPTGSSVENGLTSAAIAVHRAVCAQFPQITSYGGLRPGDGGAHGQGRALDIMVTGSLGDSVAAFVRENYRALGVTEVIWKQRIWTVERASEGWRPMSDRGSATANHYDHVHVTT
jgi:hypothetical protein